MCEYLKPTQPPKRSDHFWKWMIILFMVGLQGYGPVLLLLVSRFIWHNSISAGLWIGASFYFVLTTVIIALFSKLWDVV